VILPRMSGPDLVERLLCLQPDLRVVYMSGYTDEALSNHVFSADMGSPSLWVFALYSGIVPTATVFAKRGLPTALRSVNRPKLATLSERDARHGFRYANAASLVHQRFFFLMKAWASSGMGLIFGG